MFTGFMKHAGDSLFARGFKAGVAETFGWQVKKVGTGSARRYVSEGFMGRMAKGGIKGNFLGNVVGMAAVGYAAYTGYKEGGVVGAAKEVGSSALTWGLIRGSWNMAAGAVGSVPLAIGAAVAGGAYGYYRLGEAGIKHAKKMRNLEMGGDVIDTFGTMATMRQRSLSAIQNTHVNGRLALGGEASLLHTPMMR